ncbi:MAG TPA: hypothetical protein VF663_15090, partial [Telluria sp.]
VEGSPIALPKFGLPRKRRQNIKIQISDITTRNYARRRKESKNSQVVRILSSHAITHRAEKRQRIPPGVANIAIGFGVNISVRLHAPYPVYVCINPAHRVDFPFF